MGKLIPSLAVRSPSTDTLEHYAARPLLAHVWKPPDVAREPEAQARCRGEILGGEPALADYLRRR
jgi:hypothetical protein